MLVKRRRESGERDLLLDFSLVVYSSSSSKGNVRRKTNNQTNKLSHVRYCVGGAFSLSISFAKLCQQQQQNKHSLAISLYLLRSYLRLFPL